MTKPAYPTRITTSAIVKRSSIILALDLSNHELAYYENLVEKTEANICAVKMNFHLLLSLSRIDIRNLNDKIHGYGMQSIADIKLNDILATNKITLENLSRLKFDAVIVNPIVGVENLRSVIKYAHVLNMGIICLVQMSPLHRSIYQFRIFPDQKSKTKSLPLYELFLQYSIKCKADGIIVGGTHKKVLKHVSSISKIPVYSPGIGIQGGDPIEALSNGSKYLIVGRLILDSKDPASQSKKLKDISNSILGQDK